MIADMRKRVQRWIAVRQVGDIPEGEKLLAFGLWLENELFNERADAEGQRSPADAVHKDAARYRFLEDQCRKGAYRGIISREAIDAAILAANGEKKS